MRTSTKKSQRRRSPPKRYVARPSKQGWGVDEGDGMFLDDDERFHGSKPSDFGAGGGTRRSPPGARTGATAADSAAGGQKPSAGRARQSASSIKRGPKSSRSKDSAGGTRGRKQSILAALSSADSPDLRYDCPSCDKVNLNRQGLAVHFGMKHGGEIDLSKCVSVKYTAVGKGGSAQNNGKRKRASGGSEPAAKRSKSGKRDMAVDPSTIRYDCPSCSKSGMTKHGFCVHYGLKHEGTIKWDKVHSYVDSSARGKSEGKMPSPAAAKSTRGPKSADKARRYDCPEPKCGKVGMTKQGLRVHYGIKHVGCEIDWARTKSYVDRSARSEPESTIGRSGSRQASSRAADSASSHGRKSNRSRRPRQPRPTEKIMEFHRDQKDAKPRAAETTKRAGRGTLKGAGGSTGGDGTGSPKKRLARTQGRRHKHCGKCKFRSCLHAKKKKNDFLTICIQAKPVPATTAASAARASTCPSSGGRVRCARSASCVPVTSWFRPLSATRSLSQKGVRLKLPKLRPELAPGMTRRTATSRTTT